ncbi:hypothetical protein [Vibrio sp. 624788]|uniref:hypothetical protein n=1 Tax=Vibrio sp. 624788 TaxID=1234362 RepID=UPI0003791779|nr:hypothetical protein [Vibrio sp. 624788]
MKRLLLVMALACITVGCSNLGKTFTTNQFTSTTVIEVADVLSMNSFVEYRPYEELAKIEEKRAETAFSIPDFSTIPSNGVLKVKVSTGDIDSASSSFWRVVIKDTKGNVVFNKLAEPSVADYSIVNGYTSWHNLFWLFYQIN